MDMNIKGNQVTAARALLGWTRPQLADHANVSLTSVQRFESQTGDSTTEIKEAIFTALQKAGIDFSDGGVRPRLSKITVFEGSDSYLRILDDVFYTLKDTTGEALFVCIDDRKNPDAVIEGYRRARKTGVKMRFLVEEGNTFLMGHPEEYHYIPAAFYHNNPQVIYGNKIATMTYGFLKQAVVIENALMVEAQKNIFNYLWDKSKKARMTDAKIRYDI